MLKNHTLPKYHHRMYELKIYSLLATQQSRVKVQEKSFQPNNII